MSKKSIALLALSSICALSLSFGLTACAKAKTGGGGGNGGGNGFTPPEPTMYTVTFDAHNGEDPEEVPVEENDIVYAPVTNPSWPGHTFVGWYETETAAQAQAANTAVVFPQIVTGDITYHAGWTTGSASNVTIYFTLQGGTLQVDGQSVTSVSVPAGQVNLSTYTPVKQGYDFDGWTDDDDRPVTSVNVTGDTYLTANWMALVDYSYDVVLSNVEGEAPVIAKLAAGSKRVDDVIELPELTESDYDAESYTFIGYYLDGQLVEGEIDLSVYTEPTEITIEARFGIAYTVRFDLGYEASEEVLADYAPQRVEAGNRASIVVPNREGYRFLGWYDQATGGQQLASATATNYTPTEDVTLHARWAQLFTVYFEYGSEYEDEMNIAPRSGIQDENITLNTPAFPTGTSSATHTFRGWSTSATYTEDTEYFTGTYTIEGHDEHLYAHFIEIPEITVRWAVEVGGEIKYMPDSYNVTVREGARLTEAQIPTAGQVRRAFEGYVLTNWYVYADADLENGSILTALGEDESAGTIGTVISMQSLYVTNESGTYYLTAYADGFDGSGMIAYRFEAETHATITRSSGSNSFFETAASASGGVTSCNLDQMNTMTYTLYAEGEADVRIAIALSPGNGQSNARVTDGSYYTIDVNGEHVSFGSYNLPVLEGYRFNANWVTSWVSTHLQAGENTIVFTRTGNAMPNLDYLEVISPVEVKATGADITFDLGDGQFPALTRELNDQGVQIQRDTVPHGVTLTVPVGTQLRQTAAAQNNAFIVVGSIPTPIREGYVFGGWRTGSAEGVELGNNTTVPAEGLILYANWIEAKTVSFDLNAEDAEMDVTFYSFTEGSIVDVSAFVPARYGYAFMGWYTDAEAGELYTAAAQEDDITLYAHWEEAWQVYLETNDGILYGDATVWVAKNAQAGSFALPMPYRVDYAFDGWYTSEDLSGSAIDLSTWVPTEDTVLYAKWVVNTDTGAITITFNGRNNDTNFVDITTIQTVTVKAGATWAEVLAVYNAQYATKKPMPTNAAQTLQHWSRQNNNNGAAIADTETFTTNTTVYAIWG